MRQKKPKYFQSGISPTEDLKVIILIRFFYMAGNLIQSFIIMPNIEKHLRSATKVREIIMKNYIHKLFVGNINSEDLEYEKTKRYDSLVFDVYYRIKSEHNVEELAKKISQTPAKSIEVTIPKQYIIHENDIGTCPMCVSQYNCPYKKNRGKTCKEWEQL